LYEMAKERDVPGRSGMDKDELVEALADGRDEEGPGARVQSPGRAETTERSIWRGAITFGLITIPVGLYSATQDRDISFRLLSSEDGSRIKYKRVSSETGEEVAWDDIVKGYEYEKGHFVTFTHEEMDRMPVDSAHTIDVVQFVNETEIDPIGFEKSYYVAPEPTASKAYELLVRALVRSGRVAVAKITLREKESLCELRPVDGVLVLQTMHWPDEIRIPSFSQLEERAEVSEAELKMAEQLIDQLSGSFDPSSFEDSYRMALEKAIQDKIEGNEIELSPEEPEPAKVTDLLEALKASVEATKQEKKSA
ncbi:MAG TPA: Ku protein, partial [Acidimicrobiia bacterium]